MKVLAIDWGLKRIGLAYGELGFAPTLLPPLVNFKRSEIIDWVAKLCLSENIQSIIIGKPKHPLNAQKVEKLAQLLREKGLQVNLLDESLTSFEAKQRLASAGYSKKTVEKNLDSASAAILLEDYLSRL